MTSISFAAETFLPELSISDPGSLEEKREGRKLGPTDRLSSFIFLFLPLHSAPKCLAAKCRAKNVAKRITKMLTSVLSHPISWDSSEMSCGILFVIAERERVEEMLERVIETFGR